MILRSFLALICILVLIAGGGYLFREQLWETAQRLITTDMFVAADTDNFDPGEPVGTSFPDIKALYQGKEINDISQFVHDKGMLFVVNRSAVW